MRGTGDLSSSTTFSSATPIYDVTINKHEEWFHLHTQFIGSSNRPKQGERTKGKRATERLPGHKTPLVCLYNGTSTATEVPRPLD
jgi:hypothetical protein